VIPAAVDTAPRRGARSLVARAGTSPLGPRRTRAALYLASARRSWRHNGVGVSRALARPDERPVFVVGSPRSGTSFTAEQIGRVSGFADLGELRPFKAVIPVLDQLPPAEATRHVGRIIRTATRVGLVSGLRVIEQTPEATFLIPLIARAFPEARFVHLVRDGRDVAASLVGLGWLRAEPEKSADEVGNAYGAHSRFWVEPERRDEFSSASTATRAAWVWRRYESAAREGLSRLPATRSVEIRYEDLVADPPATAERLADALGAADRCDEFVTAFEATRGSASGRWRRDLDAAQLADVTAEAGPLLASLGYV